MITLQEAKDRVTRRLAPHRGVYNLSEGERTPIHVFAGTDLPGVEVVALIGTELAGVIETWVEDMKRTGELDPRVLHALLTGPAMRLLLVGYELGREAE